MWRDAWVNLTLILEQYPSGLSNCAVEAQSMILCLAEFLVDALWLGELS